jgi:hypothetical protein
MPAYYDEQGREDEYRLSFDNLFFWDPQGIGLLILGGNVECDTAAGCPARESCVQGVCL